MKVAVLGHSGQLATELRRRATDTLQIETFGRDRIDLGAPLSILPLLADIDADVIINAAAYTAVDAAEEDPGTETALTVNAASVAVVARGCLELGIPLVHISSDYVFSGLGQTPWSPDDATDPQGLYGQSKLQGEVAITATDLHHAILRTSWVFSAHGSNFVKTMLRLGAERDRLTIVADQIGGPTPAADIADACLTIAKQLLEGHTGGTYHFSGAPDVSWADFAREIFRQSGLTTEVVDIPSNDYPTKAVRPLNSRLDCSTLTVEFGIERPDWRIGLKNVLRELQDTGA
ncbi:MAG: dTDP-4-dehydrorhamnose reductase [Pseudomonadota bacterium]